MSGRRSELTRRESFRHWTTVSIRYNDQDPIGHVNNAAYSTFLEQARCMFLYPLMRVHGAPGLDLVIVRCLIDYLSELSFPGNVEIGSRVERVGNTSLATAHGIFKAGSDACAATGECVLVFFDLARRSAVTPPPALRAALEGDV